MGNTQAKLDSAPVLSTRGQHQLETSGPAILFAQESRSDVYDPKTNPNGLINFGLAENGLMTDELIAFFEQHFKLSFKDFIYTDRISGTTQLLSAICSFVNEHFNPHHSILNAPKTRDYNLYNAAEGPLTIDHFIAGSGVTSLISQFFRVVGNPGDGVLVTEPYYGAFDRDVNDINDVLCVGVRMEPPATLNSGSGGDGGIHKNEFEGNFTMKEIERLEEAFKKSESGGRKIKAVILCNPHNPLGRCYPSDVIIAYGKFCEKHNLHLFSDEIYAFSVYAPKDHSSIPQPGFTSALSFNWREDHGVDPARIHVVYGMSKDFNSSGFRMAVLISPYNADLLLSVKTTSPFMMTSTPANLLWSSLLTDKDWRESFLKENKKRLGEAYDFMAAWLDQHGVQHLPAYAGLFILANFAPFLVESAANRPLLDAMGVKPDASMLEREEALILYGVRKFKIPFASGSAFHMPEAGWMRITFSVERNRCEVGLRRIEEMMKWSSKVDRVLGQTQGTKKEGI